MLVLARDKAQGLTKCQCSFPPITLTLPPLSSYCSDIAISVLLKLGHQTSEGVQRTRDIENQLCTYLRGTCHDRCDPSRAGPAHHAGGDSSGSSSNSLCAP